MILGETQILGQVKEAYALSRRHRPAPAACERLMQAVFAAAKRSRHETEIGKGAVSIASAAVHVATRTLSEDLSQHTIAVIGAGETGRLVLEHFHSHRPKRTIVVNRTFERAAALAATVEASAWPWDRLSEAMAESDVLACTVRSAEPIINAPLLERALARRAGRPLVVLDLGLPRNVAPNVHHADLLINDLDAFRQVVDDNLCRREKEVPHVEAIIAEEIAKLGVDRQAATIVAAPVGPLIAALRESVETIRQIEAARATAGMSPAERAAVERATAAVIAKLLHVTTTSIKQLARHEVDGRLLDLVWALVDKLKGGSSAF
jgi:glutamyl-tRNA reductase